MSTKKSKNKKASPKAGKLIGTDKIKAVKNPVKPGGNQRVGGLGRGLGSLIAPTKPAPAPEKAPIAIAPVLEKKEKYFELPIAEIDRSPWQARMTFDELPLGELADSIKANGIITPLTCRRLASGRYELICGERRLRAAQSAGLTKVPVMVIDATDGRAAEMGMIENIQREDLNVIEEAEGYKLLSEKFGLTQQEISERVGKARASIANSMRLLELPDEVKQLISGNLISMGHAKVLLGLDNPTEQILLGRKCVSEGLTVRALERLIARRNETGQSKNVDTAKPDLPEEYLRDLSDRLHRHFGTAVRLTSSKEYANGKRSKGLLEIEFYDNGDLSRILELLGLSVNE